MGNLFKPGVEHDYKNVEKLKYFVNIKNAVSEYVWYMLSGALVTSITYNYVVNMTCSRSVKDMAERQRKYEAEKRANKKKLDAENKLKQKDFVNT